MNKCYFFTVYVVGIGPGQKSTGSAGKKSVDPTSPLNNTLHMILFKQAKYGQDRGLFLVINKPKIRRKEKVGFFLTRLV